MSTSHGHRTMGGIEYNEGGYVEKTKKEKAQKREKKREGTMLLSFYHTCASK